MVNGAASAKATAGGTAMAELETEITTYESMREGLEAEHMGKWALLHDHDLIGLYDTFDAVAREAVKRFGRGPYLIRQIGARPATLPASVMFQPVHGPYKLRV
jgi:hypothetical protein